MRLGAESTPHSPVSAFLTDVLLIAFLITFLDAVLIAFLITILDAVLIAFLITILDAVLITFLITILDTVLIAFLIAFLDVVAVSVSVLVRLLTDVLVAHVELDDGRAARLTSSSR
jgi:hypothetical protein